MVRAFEVDSKAAVNPGVLVANREGGTYRPRQCGPAGPNAPFPYAWAGQAAARESDASPGATPDAALAGAGWHPAESDRRASTRDIECRLMPWAALGVASNGSNVRYLPRNVLP